MGSPGRRAALNAGLGGSLFLLTHLRHSAAVQSSSCCLFFRIRRPARAHTRSAVVGLPRLPAAFASAVSTGCAWSLSLISESTGTSASPNLCDMGTLSLSRMKQSSPCAVTPNVNSEPVVNLYQTIVNLCQTIVNLVSKTLSSKTSQQLDSLIS